MPPVSIRMERLTKVFGNTRAVDGIDLVIEPGELFFMLGPSGCGKSTLITVLAGLIPRPAGEARLPGDGSVAYVPQGNSCFPWLRAEENVAYGLKLRGVGRRERAERAAHWLSHAQWTDGWDSHA